MAKRICAAVCITGAAACDGGEATAPAQPVRLLTYEPPALVAFRDEMNPEWLALPVGKSSVYELGVNGRYEIAVGCEGLGEQPAVSVTVYGRTPEDGTELNHRCPRRSRPYRLRANVVQSGDLTFDGRSQGSTGHWWFEVSAAPGSFALVMRHRPYMATADHIGIRRDIEIVGDTDLGEIDPSQEATFALLPREVVISNQLAEERLRLSVSLLAGGTRVSLLPQSDRGPAMVAPDDLLLPADQQLLTVSTSSPPDSVSLGRGRSLTRELRAGPPIHVTLPEPLESVMIESAPHRTVASWVDLPAHDVVMLSSNSLGTSLSSSRSHQLVVSRAFLAETGARSLTLDLRGIPGMKSEWLHDPALDLGEGLAVRRMVDGDEQTSRVSKSIRATRGTAAPDAEGDGASEGARGLERDASTSSVEDRVRTRGL